ncbi:hypothetical protein AC249_AIPGENE5193 [Exaiptasia diaphana]|nr:hypothetical protein AC249_AIPGENE5193 [Exaiptasia diaphana]
MNTKTILVLVVIASVLVLESIAVPVQRSKAIDLLLKRFQDIKRLSKKCNRIDKSCYDSRECFCDGVRRVECSSIRKDGRGTCTAALGPNDFLQ